MRKPNKLWNCETAMLKMGKERSWQLDRFSADDEAASNMCVCVFFSAFSLDSAKHFGWSVGSGLTGSFHISALP